VTSGPQIRGVLTVAPARAASLEMHGIEVLLNDGLITLTVVHQFGELFVEQIQVEIFDRLAKLAEA
jgi:hypothetical protein